MKLVDTAHIGEANAITHGGVFHADEVLASAILDCALDGLTVCRVLSVPETLPKDAIVYDIGGGRYDHHQKNGNGSRPNGIPYASAGLVWRDFGKRVLSKMNASESVWLTVDQALIQGVDAVDNGRQLACDDLGQMPFSQIIATLNPADGSEEASASAFCFAARFAKTLLESLIARAQDELQSKAVIEEAIRKSDNHVLMLDKHMPWESALFESTNEKADELYFVIYPSVRGGYNWQCIPHRFGERTQRISVPTSWRGLAGADLRNASRVPDAVFCHPSGFLGVAETKQGALAMAEAAIRESNSKNFSLNP